MNKALLALVGMVLLTSCIRANYEDVSEDERYSSLVGQKYRSSTDLMIHGITDYPHKEKVVGFYLVTEKPGIGGPEVTSRDLLQSGTLVRIERVMDCTNCFESGIYLQIKILSQDKYRNHPTRIYIEPSYQDGKAMIDSELFMRVID